MNRLRHIYNVLCILAVFSSLYAVPQKPWTALCSKVFSQEDFQAHKNKSHIAFSKENTLLFSQLIFSWNAYRPSRGFFSFFVSVRESDTGKWSNWHRMIDWGACTQRSYLSKDDDFSHYDFVRLEIDSSRLANGFRIKIIAQEGASLALVQSLAVSIANLNDFLSENIDHGIEQLQSVHIKNVPMIAQLALDHPRNDAICSPTSCSMMVGFLLGRPIDPLTFAEKSYDQGLGVFGSWPFNMAHAFEVCNGAYRFYTARLNSFARIHARLRKNIPVVVSVRGPLEGAERPYRHGHLLVVVGYDAKRKEVIAHDPAFKTHSETERRYPLKSFLNAWERSRCLAYIAEKITN